MSGRIAVHGVALAVDRIETGISIPGLVEMQAVYHGIEQLGNAGGLGAQPVIG
jgi:hypothetical protein